MLSLSLLYYHCHYCAIIVTIVLSLSLLYYHCHYCTIIVNLQVIEGLLSQCKKRDLGYKAVAIETTGIILESLQVDKFTEFYEQLSPILDKVSGTLTLTSEIFRGLK